MRRGDFGGWGDEWVWFTAYEKMNYETGNCVGLAVSISRTLALRGANPNLIYAMCLGGAFCVLQRVALFLFKQPLSQCNGSASP